MQWRWSNWCICNSLSQWIPLFSSPSGETGNSITSGITWRCPPGAVPHVTDCPQSEILTCNFRGWVSERISELTQQWGVLLSDESEAGWSTGSLALILFTNQGHLCALKFQKGRHHLVDVVIIWAPSKPSWPWLCLCVCAWEREREMIKMFVFWPDAGERQKTEVQSHLLDKFVVVESKRWIQTSTSSLYYLLSGKFKLIHWRHRKNCSESEITQGRTLHQRSLIYLESLDSSWNEKSAHGSPGNTEKGHFRLLKNVINLEQGRTCSSHSDKLF